MWLQAIKLAAQAGSKIYANRQKAKMEKLDNIKEVKVGEQQTEIDPRSKTTADKAFNLISTGGPEIEVQGQGKVMPEKRRKSKAY